MPSCVFQAEDGEVLVGRAALRLSALRPERFDPQPRRLVGLAELYLGSEPVAITDLIGAVLRQAMSAAMQQQGGNAPTRVLLSHPAHWGDGRQAALLDAAEYAGIRDPELLTEAEAAAHSALRETQPGQNLAVCDVGGARCGATVIAERSRVLRWSAPRPSAIRSVVMTSTSASSPISASCWLRTIPTTGLAISEPSNARERREAQALRDEVRRAKEVLSSNEACELAVPGITPEIQLTRSELEG